jgi:hypothetical protein
MVRSPVTFQWSPACSTACAGEGPLGVGVDVEEVAAAQVGVALVLAGAHAAGADGDLTDESSGTSATVMVPSTSSKRPRTLVIMRWRATNSTEVCLASMS